MTELTEKTELKCWEFLKCAKKTREKCDAYTKGFGEDCWIVNDTKKGGHRKGKKGENVCLNCSFFRLKNPDIPYSKVE